MRNLTKASREASRATQFQYLTEKGYNRETYKNLEIFTHPIDLLLKVYIGTAANHSIYYKYRTEAQMLAKVQDVKNICDRTEQYKAAQKEKNKGHKSSHAAASAAIKQELKNAFPNTKFSVKSESFAGGNSVDVYWTDGQTESQINEIVSKYQYGRFNGMDDIYENTNTREDIPQAKYVSASRTISKELIGAVKEELMKVKAYSEADLYDYRNNPEAEAYRLLINTTVPNYYEFIAISYDSQKNEYKINFSTQEEPKQTEAEQPQQTTEKAGKIQIVDYSEKAIAVIGEISEHYDNLIALGGSYNSRLKCGKGIIFSKKRLEAVKGYFLSLKATEQGNSTQSKESAEFEQVNSQESETIKQPEQLPTEANFETPEDAPQIEYFKIIWHEGKHIEGATFDNTTFETWEQVQRAFYRLWQVNEQGQRGGYTKVKCEMKQPNKGTEIFRVDITDEHFDGDFNPSIEHIATYISHF